jgi:hypothetical protein
MDIVDRILADSAYAFTLNNEARERKISQTTWNPLSWGLPDMHTVEIDWKKVARKRDSMRDFLRGVYYQQIGQHYENARLKSTHERTLSLSLIREKLVQLEIDALRDKRRFREKQQLAQKKTMANVQESVGTYEFAVDTARFVRDTSAGTIVVGASVLSGGAAAAALGGGSALKGFGKYQDTGNVAAGVMEFTVSFTTGLIPGPPAGATGSEKIALLVVKGKLEIAGNTAVGLVEGKSMAEALTSATVDATVGAVMDESLAKILKVDGVTEEISKMTLPGVLKVTGTGAGKTAGSRGRGAAVNKIFERPKRPRAVLGAPVLVGEPSLADLAIIGPDQSTTRRLLPKLVRRQQPGRRRPGVTGR